MKTPGDVWLETFDNGSVCKHCKQRTESRIKSLGKIKECDAPIAEMCPGVIAWRKSNER